VLFSSIKKGVPVHSRILLLLQWTGRYSIIHTVAVQEIMGRFFTGASQHLLRFLWNCRLLPALRNHHLLGYCQKFYEKQGNNMKRLDWSRRSPQIPEKYSVTSKKYPVKSVTQEIRILLCSWVPPVRFSLSVYVWRYGYILAEQNLEREKKRRLM